MVTINALFICLFGLTLRTFPQIQCDAIKRNQNFIKTENIMGVYRNYPFLPTNRQTFSKIQISNEIVVFSAIFIYNMYNAVPSKQIVRLEFYYFMKLLNGPILMLGGILTFNSYEVFINKFMSVNYYYQNESN